MQSTGIGLSLLATLATVRHRQLQCCDRPTRSSVAVWHFSIVRYLADDCRLVADARERRVRRLRSTHSEPNTCHVVTQTYSTFGDRAFAAMLDWTMEQSSIAPDREGLIVQQISDR